MNAPSATRPLAGQRVLVVDDDETVCDLLRGFLEHLGAHAEIAADGSAGLERLKLAPFDALLTDLRMPRLDGLALLAAARAFDPDLVVVVMTGYASFDSALTAVRLGVHDYLRKPFDLIEVERTLTSALDARSRPPLVPELAATLRTSFAGEAESAESAASALPPLLARCAARAWSLPTGALNRHGLLEQMEAALLPAAPGSVAVRATIDPERLRLWVGTSAEAPPVFEFPRPAAAEAEAA